MSLSLIAGSIIAIHGLDGSSHTSWTCRDPNTGVDVCWLKDEGFLPSALPKARVLTYDYDVNTSGASLATLEDHASSLVKRLHLERGKVCSRSFVCGCVITHGGLGQLSAWDVQWSFLLTV
jgi:hypothetical protein